GLSDGEKFIEWHERRFQLDPFSLSERANLIDPLYRVGDYERLIAFIKDCELCTQRRTFLMFGLLGLASPEHIERDRPYTRELLSQTQPDGFAVDYERQQMRDFQPVFFDLLEAVQRDDPVPRAVFDDLIQSENGQLVALAGWLGADADSVFDAFDRFFERRKIDARALNLIMVDSRMSVPPRMRALPRYHAYFDNRVGRGILAYRKKNGLLGGRPLKPEEVAEEEERLAALGLVPGPPLAADE
ncbi:MAG: hypothetical protein AAFQ13_09800, partial [Pseudomonadota bacterium]